MEDATHYFFHRIKYIDERQVFNDTVRVFQPLTTKLILFEAKTGTLKQLRSCSGLSADIFMIKMLLITTLTLALKLISKQILKLYMYIQILVLGDWT